MVADGDEIKFVIKTMLGDSQSINGFDFFNYLRKPSSYNDRIPNCMSYFFKESTIILNSLIRGVTAYMGGLKA